MGSTGEGARRAMLGIVTAILVAAALSLAQAVLAPIAFALFILALVLPLETAAERILPRPLALLLTLLVTLCVLLGLASAAGWAFLRAARWVIANAGLLQTLYVQKLGWLEGQGVVLDATLSASFHTRWMVRLAQGVLGQVQGVLTFVALTLIYVLMGLLEANTAATQLRRIGATRPAASRVLAGLAVSAAKLRQYMVVRTLMSALTGLGVWAFAALMGLDLAIEWGVIAFVLNYIPFIGPLVATIFPTVFAGLQFGAWDVALTVFLALQVIQNTVGSYIEPRFTGARLALSPFMVLAAVFLGAFLWGIPGAFIGVPAMIAGLALCEQFEGSRWVAALLSGQPPAED